MFRPSYNNMFKKFLNLFSFFRRLEAKQLIAEKEKEERQKYIITLYWNDQEEKWEAENRRKEDVREKLLNNQKFLKLRISRQTF